MSKSSDNDAQLIKRSAAGDRAAFEALLRRHYDVMHRIAWRFLGSRDDADDVVHEIAR